MSDERTKEPTNKELRAEVERLSAQLGLETTPGTSKAHLLEQLEELRREELRRAVRSAVEGPADGADGAEGPAVASDGPLAGVTRAARGGDANEPPAALARTPLQIELEQIAQDDPVLADRLDVMIRPSFIEDAMIDRADRGLGPLERAELASTVAFVRALTREVAPKAPHVARALEEQATRVERAAQVEPATVDAPPYSRPLTSGAVALARPQAVAGGYQVAPGRSITSKRGILGPGTEVAASDIEGGDEQLLGKLAHKGLLVRT